MKNIMSPDSIPSWENEDVYWEGQNILGLSLGELEEFMNPGI